MAPNRTRTAEKRERARRQAVFALAAPGCPLAEAKTLLSMTQNVPAGEGSYRTGGSPVAVRNPGSTTTAALQDPFGPVPPLSEQKKAACRDKVAAINAKIGNHLENARSLTQANDRLRRGLSLQKDITLAFSRDIRRLEAERDELQKVIADCVTKQEMANKIIKELMEDKLNLQIKCSLQQEETVKALRERIVETKEAIEAYKERDRCLEAVRGMKEDMRRGTIVIEGVKKENEELRAQLEAYRAVRKTDSQ